MLKYIFLTKLMFLKNKNYTFSRENIMKNKEILFYFKGFLKIKKLLGLKHRNDL